MPPSSASHPAARRLSNLRDAMLDAGIDALVVTHLPNIRYLTGFEGSAGAVLVTRSECVLAVDFRYVTAARALLEAREDEAVRLHVSEGSFEDALAELLRVHKVQRIGIEAAAMVVSRFNRLSAAVAGASPARSDKPAGGPALVPTERLVERLRVVKDQLEAETIREAAARLSRVAVRVREFAQPGLTETEVASAINGALRAEGFERPAFDPIVASGPNAALPHARPGPRRLQPGDGVVLDFGGVYDGYCVDLTRTLQLGPRTADFGRMFDAVAEAQAAAIAAVRPGARGSTIDAAARTVLDRHGLGEAFGHATGHGLGLELHEEPRIARAVAGGADPVIETGMIFTIEPGVYVPAIGGVRIEDDVLVTADGCEVLTRVPIEL